MRTKVLMGMLAAAMIGLLLLGKEVTVYAGAEITKEETRSLENIVDGAKMQKYVNEAVKLSKHEILESDWIYVLQIQPDGHGVAFCRMSADASGYAYSFVLRTEDGGNTWIIPKGYFAFARGDWDIPLVTGQYVAFVGFCDKSSGAELYLSDDYGENFYSIGIDNMLGVTDASNINAEICDINVQDKTMKVRFWVHPIYENKQTFYMAEFDLQGNLLHEMKKDESLLRTIHAYSRFLENKFIFQESSSRYLLEDEITELAAIYEYFDFDEQVYADMLRTAVNEIYARHGYEFKGTGFESTFYARDWYQKLTKKRTVEEQEWNVYEKANIDLLVEVENEFKEYVMKNDES